MMRDLLHDIAKTAGSAWRYRQCVSAEDDIAGCPGQTVATHLADEINKFVEEVRVLGPLDWRDNVQDSAPHLSPFEFAEEVAHGR